MNFYMFLSQIPANPSSLRVNVWRKLRAAGALGLQNGVWVLPKGSEQNEFLEGLLETIQQQGASGQIFTVTPLNEAIEQDILARFHNDRDEEYAEIQERSHEFLAEIEENEQDLQRLTSWLERVQKRDFIGGEKAQHAAEVLEACRAAFEAFATEVYNRQASESSHDSGEAK